MQIDLEKLQKHYFEAGVDNIKTSNDINLEITRQLITLAGYLLLFPATLFFFLQGKLNDNIVFIPFKFWLSIAVSFAAFSLMFGVVHLSAARRHLLKFGANQLKISRDITAHIMNTGSVIVDEEHGGLSVEEDKVWSGKKANVYLTLQSAFCILSLFLVILPVIIILISD